MPRKIETTKRGAKPRKSYPIVVIVCEGEKTEPNYFRNFKQRHKPLQIEIVTGSSGKSYDALIKEAVRAKKKHIDGTGAKWSVWCVSDVDGASQQQLDVYKKAADQHGFDIALSNPCFELWYQLHYQYTTSLSSTYSDLVKKLPKELVPYDKTRDIYEKLQPNEEMAIVNAKKLEQHHGKQGVEDMLQVSINPYTNVFMLVESLR